MGLFQQPVGRAAVAEARPARPAPRPVPGFPELADAAAAWGPDPGTGPEQEMGHAAGTWQPLIPCDNPTCRGGGFDLTSVVERMTSFRETEKAGILVCSGWEGGAAPDAGEGTPCVRTIRYRLTLAYRAPSSSMPAGPSGVPPKASGGPAGTLR
jgi:hypothetical protein